MNAYLSIVSQNHFAVPESSYYIASICSQLGWHFESVHNTTTNLAQARSMTLDRIKELEGKDTAFVIFLDSDISIKNPMELKRYMEVAEKLNINMSANYICEDLRNVLSKKVIPKGNLRYTTDELKEIDDLGHIDYCGMGLTIIPKMDLNYRFTLNESGEDINMINDLNLDIRYMKKLKLGHFKTIELLEEKWWENV